MYKVTKEIFVIKAKVQYMIKLMKKAKCNIMQPNKYVDKEPLFADMERCPQYIIQLYNSIFNSFRKKIIHTWLPLFRKVVISKSWEFR